MKLKDEFYLVFMAFTDREYRIRELLEIGNRVPSLIGGELQGFKTIPWLLIGNEKRKMWGLLWVLLRIQINQEKYRKSLLSFVICVCVFTEGLFPISLFCWSRGKWNKPIITLPIKQEVFANLMGIFMVSALKFFTSSVLSLL